MMRNSLLLLFTTPFLALILAVALFHSGCDGAGRENVIAIINGKDVTVDLLETYLLENLNGDLSGQDDGGIDQTEEEINKVKSRLLEDFIDTQLMAEQAKEAGISISDEEAIRFMRELGVPQEGAAEANPKKIAWIKDLMSIQKFKNERLFSDIVISEDELKQYFEKQISGKSEHQRFLLEIAVFETEKEAQNTLKKLKAKRETFNDVIEKYAMIPGKTDPQPYFLDELPAHIREEVMRMEKGDISKVLPLLERPCLIKMEGIEKTGSGSFEKVSEDLREKMIREKEEAVFEKYLHDLRKNSEVRVFYKRLPFDFIADR